MATVRRANATAAEEAQGASFGSAERLSQQPTAAQDEQELQNTAMQEMDEAEVAEDLLQPYAVTAKGGLRLRTEPRLDAPIVAVLPCGAGVFGDGEPGPDGWMHVFTGRLAGWMMDKFLEPLGLGHGDG